MKKNHSNKSRKSATGTKSMHNSSFDNTLELCYADDSDFFKHAHPVVNCIMHTGRLPEHYITQEQAKAAGWKRCKALNNFAPGKALGGDRYINKEGHSLPTVPRGIWYEADIGQDYTRRRSKNRPFRIIYSEDRQVYGSCDHYKTIFPIYQIDNKE